MSASVANILLDTKGIAMKMMIWLFLPFDIVIATTAMNSYNTSEGNARHFSRIVSLALAHHKYWDIQALKSPHIAH